MVYLFTEWAPARALGLLVALGQCSVTGAQALAGSIVYLHGDALGGPLLGKALHVCGLFVAQEVFEPGEEFWEFPMGQI